FFFASRGRHTRFSRDWSSDVCSSDLLQPVTAAELPGLEAQAGGSQPLARLTWLCALASGNGALMPGFSPNDRYKLLKWPQTERRSEERRVGRERRDRTQADENPSTDE